MKRLSRYDAGLIVTALLIIGMFVLIGKLAEKDGPSYIVPSASIKVPINQPNSWTIEVQARTQVELDEAIEKQCVPGHGCIGAKVLPPKLWPYTYRFRAEVSFAASI